MTADRKRVLDLLAELSTLRPDVRLGQWLLMFAEVARGGGAEAVYDVEDDELEPVMRAFLEQRLAEATAG